jgi:glutamine synthetase adenylyltransferase
MFAAHDAEAGERQARAVMEVARTCFRVDADLRPEGRDGPLVRTLESYLSYWGRWAEPWEFQALLKAPPVAGDGDQGPPSSPPPKSASGDGRSTPTTCGRCAP